MKRKRNAVPLTHVGGYWVLRPRLEVIENGERKTVQRAIKLIAADGRSKRPSQDVLDLAAEELRRLKGKPASPIKNLRVGEFFDTVFLPRVHENLRPSTATGYANAWAWYVQPAAFARMWLREVRTCDVQDLLDGIARTHHISTRLWPTPKACYLEFFVRRLNSATSAKRATRCGKLRFRASHRRAGKRKPTAPRRWLGCSTCSRLTHWR